ncbi:hypothetical protein OG230_00080 [Streptomyces sp. NBC_00234]|uniref:hypothetical protein n=1 Tax=Streptomyces sp. NBC_00234 TaxID=2903638 RepID=UPI002E2E6AE6|nr:hypothetical protein [Streptomyces sp. NBC_00234]
MNLYISAENALLFAAACAVGGLVYRCTKNQQSTARSAASGDLLAALGAAAFALALLAFLFGVGDGSSTGAEPPCLNEPATSSNPPSRG